jgi:hypothetical protein
MTRLSLDEIKFHFMVPEKSFVSLRLLAVLSSCLAVFFQNGFLFEVPMAHGNETLKLFRKLGNETLCSPPILSSASSPR